MKIIFHTAGIQLLLDNSMYILSILSGLTPKSPHPSLDSECISISGLIHHQRLVLKQLHHLEISQNFVVSTKVNVVVYILRSIAMKTNSIISANLHDEMIESAIAEVLMGLLRQS